MARIRINRSTAIDSRMRAEYQPRMQELAQAVAYIRQGDIQRAGALLSEILRVQPRHPDALQLLGFVHRREGRQQEAIACFRASLAVREAQPHVHNNLGSALRAAGQTAEAERHFRRALALQPRYADAAANLALMLLDQDKAAEARALLELAIESEPKHAAAVEALGIALGRLGDADGALAAGQRAVQLAPNSHTAQHNLGRAANVKGAWQVAERAYGAAVRLNPRSELSWIGLGDALRSQEKNQEALAAYARAVEANPSNTDAHRLLNDLLWQAGEERRFLASYQAALRMRPRDARLRLAYAEELLRIQKPEAAQEQLAVASQELPEDPFVNDALARAASLLRNYEQAIMCHRRAITASSEPLLVKSYLETLLKAGRHDKARDVSATTLESFPHDQSLLALHVTALELTGDERHRRFADYERMARVFAIDPPETFQDAESFNGALAEQLRALHATKNHPIEQTVRGGTQTFGALFARTEPLIASLRQQIEKAIAAYIAEMPDDPEHPFFGRKSKSFAFSGSWSVRLGERGYHTNHIHPKGWISSAYYVTLPEDVNDSERHHGWFKLGETNLCAGEKVQRFIRPGAGRLVLFPSYFWHGTVPFHSAGERLTVAFDVVPR